MLQISESTLSAMGGDRFDRKLASYLARLYPEAAAMQEDALLAYVSTAMSRAKADGFRSEQQVCDVVEARWIQGDGFWDNPTYKLVQSAAFKTPAEKASRIRRTFITAPAPAEAR